MNPAPFAELLKRAIGLDAASIGASAVDRAVRQRQAALHCPDPDAYLERVRASEAELQELVEAIVVPETWFFRDPEAFAALADVARREWLLQPAVRRRVLSLPCSTGEEPYSIAMTLLDAGLAPGTFRVDALDVSRLSLRHAGRAAYGRNSFRGANLAFRDRHFSPAGARWRLEEPARGQVAFELGNILDPALAAGRGPYDAVFCRNLLIYFDRPTQDRAVRALAGLLSPQGWFFVGPSETALLLDHGFVPARVPRAFAFRPPGAVSPQPAPRPAPRRRASPAPDRPPPTRAVAPVPPAPARTAAPEDPLDAIARLAGQGRLPEAEKLCEEHIRTHGRSARSLYLLGLVRDAAGRHGDAADLYRKTLYLEPDHHEAMMHLSYLLERSGDAAGARVIAARAQRVVRRAQA